MKQRPVGMLDIVRYAKGASHFEIDIDGYLNFHYLTHPGEEDAKRLLLEAGINRIAPIDAIDGRRRPRLLLRSSPWKAGHESSPWEDVYDLDHGHVRYFGDHKPTTVGPVGVTVGNRPSWMLGICTGALDVRTERLHRPSSCSVQFLL